MSDARRTVLGVVAYAAFAVAGAAIGVPFGYFILDVRRVAGGASFTGWSLWFALTLSPLYLGAFMLALLATWLGLRARGVAKGPQRRVAVAVALAASFAGIVWA